MSLFSSIAHASTAETRGFSLRGTAAIAMALVVGVAVGATVDRGGASDASEAPVVVSSQLPHDEFIRLNTTDMAHLSPMETVAVVDSAAPNQVSEEFLRWNIDSLEYAKRAYSDQPSPR